MVKSRLHQMISHDELVQEDDQPHARGGDGVSRMLEVKSSVT